MPTYQEVSNSCAKEARNLRSYLATTDALDAADSTVSGAAMFVASALYAVAAGAFAIAASVERTAKHRAMAERETAAPLED